MSQSVQYHAGLHALHDGLAKSIYWPKVIIRLSHKNALKPECIGQVCITILPLLCVGLPLYSSASVGWESRWPNF